MFISTLLDYFNSQIIKNICKTTLGLKGIVSMIETFFSV